MHPDYLVPFENYALPWLDFDGASESQSHTPAKPILPQRLDGLPFPAGLHTETR